MSENRINILRAELIVYKTCHSLVFGLILSLSHKLKMSCSCKHPAAVLLLQEESETDYSGSACSPVDCLRWVETFLAVI